MATYGSKDLVIELKDSGGTYRDISVFVRQLGEFTVEAILEDIHGFSETWKRMVYTGFNQALPISLSGIYDDAALTPYALWTLGASRLLKITWGGSKTSVVTVLMQKWTRGPNLEKSHTFKMDLQPTGAVTEA